MLVAVLERLPQIVVDTLDSSARAMSLCLSHPPPPHVPLFISSSAGLPAINFASTLVFVSPCASLTLSGSLRPCPSVRGFGKFKLFLSLPLVPFDQASAVLLADRAWFSTHPQVRVRFRPECPGEFSLLEAAGNTVPFYAPPEFSPLIPLSWVAVVELTRLLGMEDQTNASSLRIRFRTVPIRSRAMQQRLAPAYEEVVVHDVLRHHPSLTATAAA